MRIDRTVEPTSEQQISWDLPAPFVFLEVGGHLVVRASAFARYGRWRACRNDHVGEERNERPALHPALRHSRIRVAAHESAQHRRRGSPPTRILPPGWGWHWRRWIRLHEEGRLREDYEQQFVSPERARELIRDRAPASSIETVAGGSQAERRTRVAGRRSWIGCSKATVNSLRMLSRWSSALEHAMPLRSPLPIMRPKLPTAQHLLPYLARIDESRGLQQFRPPRRRSSKIRLAAHFGVPDHAMTTVANATLGLALALTAQSVKAGTLCVMPAWTFVASPQAAAAAGLVPFFVDVDPETWALDPRAMADVIDTSARRSRRGHAGHAIRPAHRLAAAGTGSARTPGCQSSSMPPPDSIPLQPTDTPAVVSLHATKAFGHRRRRVRPLR